MLQPYLLENWKKPKKFSETKDKSYFFIENRRYLGNKNKLLAFIEETINENCKNINTICDLFAGTGVVGKYFSNADNKVVFNDILRSCTVPIKAFNLTDGLNETKILEYIKKFNILETNTDNYFSDRFGGKYFTIEVSRKIGAIRELIEKLDITKQEKYVLLTSLLYAVDKKANTVGHYDSFRKSFDEDRPLFLKLPKIDYQRNKNNEVYEEDANSLVRKLKNLDLVYIDPPYNSRQYSDSYHLLENLIRWKKPRTFGKAAKMDRAKLKSRYCLKGAVEAFKDLINNINSRYILMSYNNTGDKRDARSNNRIMEEQIISILETKGKVKVFEKSYKEFESGKSRSRSDHKETLFFCEVAK